MSQDKKYCLTISFVQSTNGETDDDVVVREFSEDPVVHVIKTQVFTRHLTEMLNAITKELTDFAIANGGELPLPNAPAEPEHKDKFER